MYTYTSLKDSTYIKRCSTQAYNHVGLYMHTYVFVYVYVQAYYIHIHINTITKTISGAVQILLTVTLLKSLLTKAFSYVPSFEPNWLLFR